MEQITPAKIGDYRINVIPFLVIVLAGLSLLCAFIIRQEFFIDDLTGDPIESYPRTGAPPIEETLKISFAAIVTFFFFVGSRFQCFSEYLLLIFLLPIGGIFGLLEVLEGRSFLNVLSHMGYSCLFSTIYLRIRNAKIESKVAGVLAGFLSAWGLHFIHNWLIWRYLDESNVWLFIIIFVSISSTLIALFIRERPVNRFLNDLRLAVSR